MNIDDLLMKALTNYDSNRSRSQQKEIGVSQIGGCRRQVWLQLVGTPKENETLKLPSLMGTAIHTMIEEAITAYSFDEYQLEIEVEYEGLKGHIDCYAPEIGAVIDWKTTKKSNLEYFPSTQQRWQVQLYGYLLSKNGSEPKTVTLVAIPRDGDERQIKIHTEEFSPEIAAEALAWLEDVKSRREAPAPEKFASFCALYCSYYGSACGGKGKAEAVETITDEVIVKAAADYIEIDKEIKALTEKKEAAKAALENVDGVTSNGIKVSWSQIAGRKSIDEAELTKLLDGSEIPYKQGDPSMRLNVKG